MRGGCLGQYVIIALLMVACSTRPVAVHRPARPAPSEHRGNTAPPSPPPLQNAEPVDQPVAAPPSVPATEPPTLLAKAAPVAPKVYETSSADYRREAAQHIYRRLPDKVYKGKMPPFLKAVVVVDIYIEPTGQIGHIDWVRLPKHNPDIKHDIEQAILQSAPFPAPSNLKRVSYTETWLWHKSGRFQLDTLTEGQH